MTGQSHLSTTVSEFGIRKAKIVLRDTLYNALKIVNLSVVDNFLISDILSPANLKVKGVTTWIARILAELKK